MNGSRITRMRFWCVCALLVLKQINDTFSSPHPIIVFAYLIVVPTARDKIAQQAYLPTYNAQ